MGKSNWLVLRYVLILFIGWRLVFLFITFLGLGALPSTNHYTHELFPPGEKSEYWLRWTNWDGLIFQDIAAKGYTPLQTVFFPGYPLLIKAFTLVGFPSFLAGFIIAQIATIAALFYLYKLVLLDFSEKVAKRATMALLIFPTSFYLVSLYSESLTLASSLGAFYYARRNNWLLACLLAAFASLTRLAGVAAIIGVAAEYLLKPDFQFKISYLWQSLLHRLFFYLIFIYALLNIVKGIFLSKNMVILEGFLVIITDDIIKWAVLATGSLLSLQLAASLISKIQLRKIFSVKFAYLLLSLLPITLYFIFLRFAFGSPTIFLDSEAWWGKQLSFPWEAPLQSFHFLTSGLFSIGEYSARVHVRFLIFIILLSGFFISLYISRLSYILFFATASLIPLLSGTLIDLPRYTLIIFPLFIIFGMIENPYLQKILVFISILLLSMLAILYINSFFFM